MKELLRSRKIPAIAIASLAVGGACRDDGGGGGGGGPGGGSSPAAIAESYCAGLSSCSPEEFNYEFSTMEECTDYSVRYFESLEFAYSYYDEGDDCADALLAYHACIWEVFAQTCEYDYFVCYSAMIAADSACDYY